MSDLSLTEVNVWPLKPLLVCREVFGKTLVSNVEESLFWLSELNDTETDRSAHRL